LLLGSSAVYALEIPLLNFEGFKNKENLSLEEQGLNEYQDPKEHPLYNKKYNEISFVENGLSQEELESLLEIIFASEEYSFSINYSDEGEGKVLENIVSEESLMKTLSEKGINLDSVEVTGITFQTNEDEFPVEKIDYFRGRDSIREDLDNKITEIKKDREEEDLEKYLTEGDQAILGSYNTSFEKLSQEKFSVPENISNQEARNILANVESKKDNVKSQLKEQENQLIEKREKHIKIIEARKEDWDLEKSQIDLKEIKALDKIERVSAVPNRVILEMIYPSEEEIQSLNEEILEEREMIEKYNLKRSYYKSQLKENFSSIFSQTANAGNLNNFVASLVIYPRQTSRNYLRIDLSGNGVYNGNFFHMYTNNGGNAQKFKIDDNSSQIKYNANQGYCMDIDLNGGYSNGDKVQLWQCHSGGNQKWKAFKDGSIRPLEAQGYCLDVDTAMEQGRRLQIWQCNGQTNQGFQIGEEDFGVFSYYIRLHASISQWTIDNLTGHALVSMPKKQNSNGHWHVTNTFSYWGNLLWEERRDGDDSIEYSNSSGRTNNMRIKNINTNDWSNLNIDNGGGGTTDWNIGTMNPADLGGEFSGYRRTTSGITKQKYEEIKYMNGYNFAGYSDVGYDVCHRNCASYSALLYNRYNKSTDPDFDPRYNPDSGQMQGCYYPGNLWKAL
jgi:hypothetical protein